MGQFELPALPYEKNALEPHIDEETMGLHHGKHHQTYTGGLNAALESAPELQGKPIAEILSNLSSVPDAVRGAVNFHGGGYENHAIFWATMGPNAGGAPSGPLADAINSAFGDFDSFKEEFSGKAATVQGSGWAWLALNSSGGLEIKQMPNQTSARTEGLVPLLGIDVWEHAYYLKYKNVRPDYIKSWWNVVNWDAVSERFQQASS
jgi:Fe-Mn family superoxide dismutase